MGLQEEQGRSDSLAAMGRNLMHPLMQDLQLVRIGLYGLLWKLAGLTGIMLLGLALTGCGGVSPGQAGLVTSAVSGNGNATVVLAVNRSGRKCPKPSFVIGRAKGDRYEKVAFGELGNTILGYEHFKTVSLPPGTYHVVLISCHEGGSITSIGKTDLGPGFVTRETIYRQSLASFHLDHDGEVVNVGQMNLIAYGRLGTVVIKPMSSVALRQFQKVKPELAGKAVTRLMVKG